MISGAVIKDPQTYAIIGAAMEVHKEMGCGFLEAVYRQAMILELTSRAIEFQRELSLCVQYKGQPLPCGYRADFVCYREVLVEIKSGKAIDRYRPRAGNSLSSSHWFQKSAAL